MGVIYRPNSHPRADLDFFTRTVLTIHDKVSSENKIAYLMGDFNINLLNFATNQKYYFIDNIITQRSVPHITNPTRITSTTVTVIDHLYSNHTHINYDSGINVTYMTYHLIYGIPLMHNIEYKQTRQPTKSNIYFFVIILARTDYKSCIHHVVKNLANKTN